jgi:hypothetical protein
MDIDTEALDILISEIPLNPPLSQSGEVTIHDLYPDLTQQELDYIHKNYTGTMKIGNLERV